MRIHVPSRPAARAGGCWGAAALLSLPLSASAAPVAPVAPVAPMRQGPARAWPALQTYAVTRLLPFRTEARLAVEPPPVGTIQTAAAPLPAGDLRTAGTRREPRLMRIGGLLLGIGYAPAVALALALSPQAGQPGSPSLATNYTLLIPAVGPVVSGVLAPAEAAPGTVYGAVTTWTLPLLLTLGLAQGTGLALLTAGAVRRPRQATTSPDPLDLNFPPWRTRP